MMTMWIKIGLGSLKGKGINFVFENFSDGTTLMTLGVIDGVLSLWYTETDEVITTWSNT